MLSYMAEEQQLVLGILLFRQSLKNQSLLETKERDFGMS